MPNTDRITFGATAGTVTIAAGDTVLAESENAVVLTENGYRPRLYFPIADVNMGLLSPSETKTSCPFKGEASYFSAETGEGMLTDIAWMYAAPIDDAKEIAGLIAFYEEKLSVEGA